MTEPVYSDLKFPDPPANRPYIAINMVSTIDGKILTGERNEPVQDLGSALDHATMRMIQDAVGGIMIGAGTLRSTPKLWYPKEKFRFVVTRTGKLDFSTRFFQDAPDKAFVVCPKSAHCEWQSLTMPEEGDVWGSVLRQIKELGISHLLVEGGSHLNAGLFTVGVIDEIFLTFAPKIKLGEEIPTIADGAPLPKESIQSFQLISCKPVEDEVFLRYRRNRATL